MKATFCGGAFFNQMNSHNIIRDGSGYENGLIFGKLPGGGTFSIKKVFFRRFTEKKLQQIPQKLGGRGGVKGCLNFF